MPLAAPRQLESEQDFVLLVRAVYAASAEDENDWIEWKSELDLELRATKARIAQYILGFANRDPDDLNDECGGTGVLVIGAEPGRLKGVDALDPAKLRPPIEAIVGGPRGPRWAHRYVELDGVKVLVITVAPPHSGDPIFTARKSSDTVTSGCVYIRKHGRTQQADAVDMDMLQARLTRGAVGQGIEVRFAGGSAYAADADALLDAAEAWVTEVVTWKSRQARERKPARRATPYDGLLADRRTLDEYIQELEEWRSDALEWAHLCVLTAATAVCQPVVLEVIDTEEKFHPGVEVVVSVEATHVLPLDDLSDPGDVPALPVDFGDRTVMLPSSYARAWTIPDLGQPSDTPFDLQDNRLVYAVGDLRPGYLRASPEMYLLTSSDNDVVSLSWKATFKGHDRQVSGIADIAVEPLPINIDVRRLLYAAADEPLDDDDDGANN